SDPAGDPDMDEFQRYWRTQSDLAALASYGLLEREITPDGQENRWRSTLEAVVEIFGALEMADDPDATRRPQDPVPQLRRWEAPVGPRNVPEPHCAPAEVQPQIVSP